MSPGSMPIHGKSPYELFCSRRGRASCPGGRDPGEGLSNLRLFFLSSFEETATASGVSYVFLSATVT